MVGRRGAPKEKTEDEKFTEFLIDEVRTRPLLWNSRLEGFSKGGQQRDDLWDEIRVNLEGQGIIRKLEEIEKKWNYLKHEFGRRLKLMKSPSGSAAERKRSWLWFEQLQFLRDEMEPRCTVSNLDEAQAENDDESGGDQATGNPDSPTTSTSSPSTQLITAAPKKTGAQQYASNRKRKLEGGEAAGMDNLIVKVAESLCQPREKASTNSAFANYVSSALDDLSLPKRLDARAEIMATLNRLQSADVTITTAEEYDNRFVDMES
ncbi:hypothetical protein BV898_18688 [Hypsibius exemplaris]|uniref:MADF domain-containing protein n=1 Tax=Hypsibius exemplaris TaxID=2072580 RepID=A0A9X6NI10_HYPEX|nr:hypothetical protein BV898_18688 [Hypsibius exemplaris]